MNLRDRIKLVHPRTIAGLLGIAAGYYFYTTSSNMPIKEHNIQNDNTPINVTINEELVNQHNIQNECADKLIKFYTTQLTSEMLAKYFVNSDGTIEKEAEVYYGYRSEVKCFLGREAFAEQRTRIITQLEKTWLPRGIRSINVVYSDTDNIDNWHESTVTFKR